MGFDPRVEGLPEPYRSDCQQCVQYALNKWISAHEKGRGLSLPNTYRVFLRQWRKCLTGLPEAFGANLLQIGQQQALNAIRAACYSNTVRRDT